MVSLAADHPEAAETPPTAVSHWFMMWHGEQTVHVHVEAGDTYLRLLWAMMQPKMERGLSLSEEKAITQHNPLLCARLSASVERFKQISRGSPIFKNSLLVYQNVN